MTDARFTEPARRIGSRTARLISASGRGQPVPGGLEVTAGLARQRTGPNDRYYVLLVTAGPMLYMGPAYLANLLHWNCFRREWLKA